jgi:hypothetical protein
MFLKCQQTDKAFESFMKSGNVEMCLTVNMLLNGGKVDKEVVKELVEKLVVT